MVEPRDVECGSEKVDRRLGEVGWLTPRGGSDRRSSPLVLTGVFGDRRRADTIVGLGRDARRTVDVANRRLDKQVSRRFARFFCLPVSHSLPLSVTHPPIVRL